MDRPTEQGGVDEVRLYFLQISKLMQEIKASMTTLKQMQSEFVAGLNDLRAYRAEMEKIRNP
jgi:hypothetical protein